MRNIKQVIHAIERFSSDNSPALLTAIGVSGTISTAILTGRSTFRAAELLREVEEGGYWEVTEKEPTLVNKAKVVWKLYIPPVGVSVVTITAIVLANQIGTRRAAAMAAAYTTLDQTFGDYKVKMVEKLGENKERAARDELAQEYVERNPASQSPIVLQGKGLYPCLDLFANRWFESDMMTIQKAEIILNKRIQSSMGMEATLNEFYDILGLPSIGVGEEMGWDANNILELSITSIMTDDGRPGLCMSFDVKPIRIYPRRY